jgi:hypothetical protein
VSDVIDPMLQIRALQELARKLPPGSKVHSQLFWENDHGATGVTLMTDGRCTVYLFGEEQEVENLTAAADVLRRVFADEIASVKAYAKESVVYGGLAPTGDPSAGFNGVVFGTSHSKAMPDIDYVEIATWTRGIHEETE